MSMLLSKFDYFFLLNFSELLVKDSFDRLSLSSILISIGGVWVSSNFIPGIFLFFSLLFYYNDKLFSFYFLLVILLLF